ncbi:redoxin domain-containing protein [Candidatus Poribacteria bacterium]|nr:redoxin domain-containing protein [Candidatus Poribacteria bacterium]MYG09038.1 redoxin domain-containing protein [Candidatus Poribacteria bacterium]MYK23245.1 redoxin domain-containing protein [Candidatus Poribacteria bacterium]
MFSRNKINSRQRRNRGFPNVLIGVFTSFVLIGFCVNLVDAYSVKPADDYKEIKAITKDLRKQSTSEDLEKLVEKSRNFVAAHPEYKRVDEVYYLLGNALVQLDRIEEGVKVFKALIKDRPDARYVERCLLELGLAYDKLQRHDEADGVYQKLVNHPKYGSRSQAKLAKKMLEQERAERNGELPKPPGAQAAPGMNPREWIGKPALDFHVTDLNGAALSLEQYRGQVVLLDFWATWCPPCIAEIPNVKKTYEKYKDQKFQIIGISLDRSREPLEAYIEKENLTWLHYWDNIGKVSNIYKVQAIPSTFLIDGEGVIRKTNLRGYWLETAVAELVEENLAQPADTPISPASDPSEGAQNTEPNVREIIDAAIAAHGGLERLQAVKNIVTESHSFEHFPDGDVQDEGRSKAYFYPDKFRSDWDIDGDVGGLIFDGNSLFRVTDGEAKPVLPQEVASYLIFFKDSLFREPIWLLPALAKGKIPVQYAGTEEVKGIPTSVLLITQPSGKKLKVFISKETHYVVQFSYEIGIGGGVENVVAFFEDYRDVDGVKVAHHRATKNGEYRQILITDIELNAEIDEALFRPRE